MDRKDILLNKQRIVIKVGTSTITYEETGNINLEKLEKFVRILINLLYCCLYGRLSSEHWLHLEKQS